MKRGISIRYDRIAMLACLAFVPVVIHISDVWASDKPIPSIDEIRKAVDGYFEDKEDYEPGDLITREQVEPLLDRMQEMGLPMPDKEEILEATLNKDNFIVRQLGTSAGRTFMRQISKFPEAYDRLDRLSRLPRGRKIVKDLVRGPGGYKMIEYMTTSAGGKEMGRMLSDDPNGQNFNDPTGRIYTAKMLINRLALSREESLEAKQKPADR